jgi:hypothetical protein
MRVLILKMVLLIIEKNLSLRRENLMRLKKNKKSLNSLNKKNKQAKVPNY